LSPGGGVGGGGGGGGSGGATTQGHQRLVMAQEGRPVSDVAARAALRKKHKKVCSTKFALSQPLFACLNHCLP
jgi:hypothetical protein